MLAPYWNAPEPAQIQSLDQDFCCDVLIIGGGIVGLATALELRKSGFEPAIICKGKLSDNTTVLSAGILTQETTVDLHQLTEQFGTDKIGLYLHELRACMLDAYTEFGAGSDWFQKGSSLYFSANKNHDALIKSEFTTRQNLDLPARLLSVQQLNEHWKGFSSAVAIDGDFAVDPAHLLQSMAKSFLATNGTIYEFACVSEPPELIADGYLTRVANYKVKSKHIVWATGIQSLAFTQKAPHQQFERASTCVVITRPSPEIARLTETTRAINFWDSHESYSYGRYLSNGRLLIGGEDRDGFSENTALDEKSSSVQALLTWAQTHHRITIPPFDYAWRANLGIPKKGLPQISVRQNNKSLSISALTDGLSNGLWLGRLIARRLNGQQTEESELFSELFTN